MNSPALFIDHTLLRPDTTEAQVRQLCEEAVEWGFAAVCIPPCHVALAAELLYGSEVKVTTVVGFPLGYAHSEVKAFEASRAVAQGADEIDMVMALGAARAGEWSYVREDIRRVVEAAEGGAVKVILECTLFDADAKRQAAEVAIDAGAAYLKTSTGFVSGGATPGDVKLLHQVAAGRAQVKASGGIRDLAACSVMLQAGAARIGTSSGVAIMRQWRATVHDA